MNPPVPTALVLLRGNPGHKKINNDEPKPPVGAVMPDEMSDDAKRHWPKIAKQLEDIGVLTEVDAVALTMYCEAFARWRHASNMVAKHGPVVKSPNGYPIQSPFLSIANKAHDQMVTLLREFGMTPSARTRVKSNSTPQKASRFLDLVDGKSRR